MYWIYWYFIAQSSVFWLELSELEKCSLHSNDGNKFLIFIQNFNWNEPNYNWWCSISFDSINFGLKINSRKFIPNKLIVILATSVIEWKKREKTSKTSALDRIYSEKQQNGQVLITVCIEINAKTLELLIDGDIRYFRMDQLIYCVRINRNDVLLEIMCDSFAINSRDKKLFETGSKNFECRREKAKIDSERTMLSVDSIENRFYIFLYVNCNRLKHRKCFKFNCNRVEAVN